jgi:hypothetical protein
LVSVIASPVFAEVPVQVQELVFEQQMSRNTNEFVYCLSVDGEDVTSEMIAQLARDDFTIVGASECTQNRDMRTGGSFHTGSRRKAIFIRVRNFLSEDPGQAIVEWESYHHGLYAEGSKLRLEVSDEVWRVVQIFEAWTA